MAQGFLKKGKKYCAHTLWKVVSSLCGGIFKKCSRRGTENQGTERKQRGYHPSCLYLYNGKQFHTKMVRNFWILTRITISTFILRWGTTGDILAGLKEDKYDIVFSSYQEGEPDIEFRKIGNQKLVVEVPQDHPLAIHGRRSPGHNCVPTDLFLKKEAGCVRSLTRCLRRSISSRRLPLRWEDSSMASLVAQGFGIAVMPDIPILKSLNLKTLEIQPSGVRAVGVSRYPEKTLPFPCGKVIYPIRLSADRGQVRDVQA